MLINCWQIHFLSDTVFFYQEGHIHTQLIYIQSVLNELKRMLKAIRGEYYDIKCV